MPDDHGGSLSPSATFDAFHPFAGLWLGLSTPPERTFPHAPFLPPEGVVYTLFNRLVDGAEPLVRVPTRMTSFDAQPGQILHVTISNPTAAPERPDAPALRFAIVPNDDTPRAYTVALDQSPGWSGHVVIMGKVSAVGVVAGERPAIHAIRLAQPE